MIRAITSINWVGLGMSIGNATHSGVEAAGWWCALAVFQGVLAIAGEVICMVNRDWLEDAHIAALREQEAAS